jgi:hypothetical protein
LHPAYSMKIFEYQDDTMTNFLRCLAPLGLFALLVASGCTEPNAAHKTDLQDTGSWINPDAQIDDGDAAETEPDATSATDASPTDSGATDSGATDTGTREDTDIPAPDVEVADVDAPDGGAPDIGAPDVESPDAVDPQPDAVGPGGTCSTNVECGAGLVCCNDGFSGARVCKAGDECRFGGFCQVDDDCAADEGCCETFGGNICSERCADDGGGGDPGSGDACQSNSDCTVSGEVCCLGLGGSTCTSNCRGRQVCQNDSECSNGDICCTLAGQSFCADPSWPLGCT